jgi:HlyD family secretion protein
MAVVHATGTIHPLTTVPVASSVAGTVKYIFADVHTRVRAGQVLAQLDPARYEAEVIQARGNLAQAEASLKALQANLAALQDSVQSNQANLTRLQAAADDSRTNAARVANLFQQGIVAQDQHDLSQANLLQAEAQVRGAEAQLRQIQARLEQTRAKLELGRAQIDETRSALQQAETDLRSTTILAPIDGTVVARQIAVGAPGAVSTSLFTLAPNLRNMQLGARTDESDTNQIKIGTDVTFHVEAFPRGTFHGRVSAKRRGASTVPNAVTYDTIIDFENPDERLLPGETAYVAIPIDHAADVLRIPNAALRFTPELPRRELHALYKRYKILAAAAPQCPGEWQVVWKLRKRRVLQPVAVKVGITDHTFTQLLEGDLKDGDLLVTGQSKTLRTAPVQSAR